MTNPLANVSVTAADKRKWLKENGFQPASRGKLSAEHEQAYNTGVPAGQAQSQG